MADAPPAPPAARPQQRLFAPASTRRLGVLNARPVGLRDLYHVLLRASWLTVLGIVAAGYFVINCGFGTLYWAVGGITNASTWLDHVFFSVHTFGTIGYGSLYPSSNTAELLVSVEALISVVLNAVITGLAFAKFARPTSRVLWSKVAIIGDRDGVPTLMFRVANERMNHVVEATVRAAILRAEVTKEGERLRRVIDLPLVRSSSPSFILTWTVMHQIVPGSPLYGLTQEQLAETETEVLFTLTGLDETLGQTIHSRYSYLPNELIYGARFQDVLSATPNGRVLDYGRFHDTGPAPLTREKMGLLPLQPR